MLELLRAVAEDVSQAVISCVYDALHQFTDANYAKHPVARAEQVAEWAATGATSTTPATPWATA